jgi:hypothetical protein
MNTTVAKEFDNDEIVDSVIKRFNTEALIRDLCLLGPIHYRRTEVDYIHMLGFDVLLLRCPAIPMEHWEAIKEAEAL